jgi:hypothetical protein
VKIIKKGGFKTLAEPSNSTATEIRYVYDQLALEIGQAKGVVRSSKGKINVAKLRSTFRGGTLDK